MTRCKICLMPSTRPGSRFFHGICQACLNFEARKSVEWDAREKEFKDLCGEISHVRNGCMVPVSGGKDSYWIVSKLVEEGLKPLLVTVTDSFSHTKAGVHNLRNLIETFNLDHWQYTISHKLFRKATRAAFEETGEALKFIEYAIYMVPVELAKRLNIQHVFFGENSAYEYGSSSQDLKSAIPAIMDIQDKVTSERKWWNSKGIDDGELNSILTYANKTDVWFMSYYFPWSSESHLKEAKKHGFKTLEGEWNRKGTVENYEQMDSVAYMVHLWLKYPKFGFQRACDIVSRRIREGVMTKEEGMKLIEKHDHELDDKAMKDFCDFCGYTHDEFWKIVNKHDRGYLGVHN